MSKKSLATPHKTAIADWLLEEPEVSERPTLFIKDIITITSHYNLEECKTLLRALIHTYLNLQQSRYPLDENLKRERKLMINYLKKEAWEWRQELMEVTSLYQMYEGRKVHKALVEIQGQVYKFESGIRHNPFLSDL